MRTGANHEDTKTRRFPGVVLAVWLFRFAVAWLILAVIGWLAYALLRALTAIIYLNVPFFDWQWYVPVTGLLIAGPICLTHCWIRRPSTWRYRRAPIAFAILLVWAIIGYNGFGQTMRLHPDQAAPIEISFWVFSDLRSMPDTVLQDIQSAKGDVYVDIGRGPYGRELAMAMHRLAEYHIEAY